MFDSSYSTEAKTANYSNFDQVGKHFIDKILSTNVNSVMDVGMGAGGLLLLLQNSGIEKIIGIEISQKGIELARKRFELFGDLTSATFIKGDFTKLNPPTAELICFNNVLHCHPDLKGMLDKAIALEPKYLIFNIPKKTRVIQTLFFVTSLFTRLANGFRPYVHSSDIIRELFDSSGYILQDKTNQGIWEIYFYKKKSSVPSVE